MNKEAKIQLQQQTKRWDERAASWDEDIKQKDHYANFEDGYQKFIDFEKKELAHMKKVEAGIDVRCGSGVTAAILAEKVKKIYLLDLSAKMLEQANKKVPNALLLHASATAIPLEDHTVDVAISRGIVVSHLPKGMQDKFFDELRRILKKDGKIIIDFLSNTETADFNNASPKVPYTKEKMKKILEKRCFSDIVFDGDDDSRVIRVSAIKNN